MIGTTMWYAVLIIVRVPTIDIDMMVLLRWVTSVLASVVIIDMW